jgi:uncharacterized protein YukE
MAQIQNVDYKAIPAQAKQMREEGQALNNELSNAYTSIANMHNNWYGNRYNELVKAFNNITTNLNDMLELVVGDFPYALETVANNYSQADTGAKITSAEKTEPKRIVNLSLSNDTGMRFMTTEVEEVQRSVSTNFSNAVTRMNNIETAYKRIEWTSEAAEAFKTKFTKLKTDIVTAFDNLNNDFKKLMTQAVNDIQSAEKANTVE